jgi:hypothetical protein
MKHLETTQRTGLAYDNEEYTSGIYCIGAPVFDAEAKIVAGVGITVLLSWFDHRRTSVFEQNVLECARRISKDIGYTDGFFSDKIRKHQPLPPGPDTPGRRSPSARGREKFRLDS